MASFQAKVGWKRLRKRENKIIVPLHRLEKAEKERK